VAEVIFYVASSLDGFIATPDGSVAWLSEFEAGDEDYGYSDFYASVDAVLLGSRTYEQALTFGAWPYVGKPSWVFSRRGYPRTPADVTVTAASPRDVVSELDARGIRRAWLVGGGAIASSFREAGLITGYIVSVMPVILGGGVALFGGPGATERLELAGSRVFDDGVVQLTYTSMRAA
jgi:dihydrofolate reductase